MFRDALCALYLLVQKRIQIQIRNVDLLSAEQYIDEYEKFKNLLETVYADTKRKKEQSNVTIAFLHFASVFCQIENEDTIAKWKGMVRLLETGFDKKAINESERELIAAILLITTEIRSKQGI